MARRVDPADRRRLLQALAMSAAWWSVPGAYAEQLVRTPAQTEGPFYPNHLPLDTDNDLLRINDLTTPAVGVVTWFSGRVLDLKGAPVRNALVEIWQVDNAGAYLHTGSMNREKRDANFQGFGRFVTGSTGEYLFRTIKPVPYPGRTPHIHVAVKTKGRDTFTTQCYIEGEPQNESDGILRRTENRDALIVPFAPLPGSTIGELTARFDIVLGFTPAA
jgi:protocatechuate 3,4-dioxygenase beta subunit